MQPLLSAVVKARHFSLSGYIVQMPDRTNAKILTASLLGELDETARTPSYYMMKTIQLDLKSSNLPLNEAIDVAQNCQLMSRLAATHCYCCMTTMITSSMRKKVGKASKAVDQ